MIDPEKSLLLGVVVQEYDEEGLRRIINAQEAFNQEGKWVFKEGIIYEVGEGGEIERMIRLKRKKLLLLRAWKRYRKSRKSRRK